MIRSVNINHDPLRSMLLTSLVRLVKFGLQNFIRNWFLSFEAVFMMTITMIIISIFFLINLVISSVTLQVKEKIDLIVYFDDLVAEQEILDLQSQLKLRNDVKTVRYISKELAYQIWQGRPISSKIKQIVSLDDNPLPRSLQIKGKDPTNLDQIAQIFNQSQFEGKIRRISYQDTKEIIDRTLSTTHFVNQITLWLAVVFVIISLLVLVNTIRLTIFSRREEIEIMRLVGASDSFIKLPFYIEELVYTIVATSLAFGALWFGLPALKSTVPETLSISPQYFINILTKNGSQIIAINFLVGLTISIIATGLSIKKHLRV